MLLLGPFGLLCGLCGKGSKVESKSELWWVCKKCGKAHIALADALKSGKLQLMESMEVRLPLHSY